MSAIVGDPRSCRDQLGELQHRYGADEIVFADFVLDAKRRPACYELLAEAVALDTTRASGA